MQAWKSSKHRCQCFSKESSSFLYGLRREAPSTERVLLERLLNVLSRAAAHQGKNPQRLWAESERPGWWTQVTKLRWKNPREHPKDNKDTLKQKIEVLERELKNRGLVTKELQDELETHRDGKKVDLELKSDFEAVISKSSGLHFMLNKVDGKMRQSRVMTDKLAKYITETKACLEKSLKAVRGMYTQVEDRERRKTSLWEKMGVSKQERTEASEIPQSDDLSMDFDLSALEMESFYHDSLLPARQFLSPPMTPPDVTGTHSPLSPIHVGDSTIAPMVQQNIYHPKPLTSVHPDLSTQKMSLPLQRSVSQPSSTLSAFEPLQAIDLSHGRNVSWSPVAPGPPAKKSRRRSAEDSGMNYPDQEYLNPRGSILQTQTMDPVAENVFVIDEEGEFVVEYRESPSATTSSQVSISPVILSGTGTVGQRSSESEVQSRGKDRRNRRSPFDRPKSLGGKEKQLRHPMVGIEHTRHSSLPTSSYIQSGMSPVASTISPAMTGKADRRWLKERQTEISISLPRSTSHPPSTITIADDDDLAVDGAEVVESELDNVVDIIEDSETPTVSMYTEPDASAMDQLAEMTVNLSCEDLTATVTEPFMGNLRVGGSASVTLAQRQYRPHSAHRPATVSSLLKPQGGDQSLSRAIASLVEDFPH